MWAVSGLSFLLPQRDAMAMAGWAGNMRASYASTRLDTSTTEGYDQEYTATGVGSLTSVIRYTASLRYRHAQSSQTDAPSAWRSELNPAVSLSWDAPAARFRADYSFRKNADKNDVGNLESNSAGVYYQSTWAELPRISAGYAWNRNTSQLGLFGKETRETILNSAADYAWKSQFFRYNFVNQEITDKQSELSIRSQQHTGEMANSFHAFDHLISYTSSYQVTARNDKQQQAADGSILVSIPPLSGLYAIDPTPDFGTLESAPGLIDGETSTAADPLMDLYSQVVHNIGLDFGAAATVDYLYLYADSVASSALVWSVYISSDNETWTPMGGNAIYPFNVVYNRFEIHLTGVSSRYIKLVVSPPAGDHPVFVTELQAFQSRTEELTAEWKTDHRADARLSFRPSHWLNAAADGTFSHSGAGPASLAIEQQGLTGGLNLNISRLASIASQYQLGRTSYLHQFEGRTDTRRLSLNLLSQWTSALRTVLSASRLEEAQSQISTRRLDGLTFRVSARWWPGLEGTTDAGYSEDHQFSREDIFLTRFVGQSVDTRLSRNLQVSGSYRYYTFGSRLSQLPPFRENVSLRASWQITYTITVLADASLFRERNRTYETMNGTISWAATKKLYISGNLDRILPGEGNQTVQLGIQSSYRWTPATEITAGYTAFQNSEQSTENSSSIRFGFNTRF